MSQSHHIKTWVLILKGHQSIPVALFKLCTADNQSVLQIRDVRRLTYLELFFLVLATLTILGLLAMAMERFVNLHRQFGQFMPEENCTNSSIYRRNVDNSQEVAELVTGKNRQLYQELQYRDYVQEGSDEFGDFGDFGDSDDHNDSCKSCDSWTCTNDFIFAVALVVNLCELYTLQINDVVCGVCVCVCVCLLVVA